MYRPTHLPSIPKLPLGRTRLYIGTSLQLWTLDLFRWNPSFATWGFPRPLDLFLGCTRPFQGVWSLVCEELYCFGLLILANSTERSLCSFNSTNCNLFLPTTLSFALPIFPFGILLGGWFGPAKDNRKPCWCVFVSFPFRFPSRVLRPLPPEVRIHEDRANPKRVNLIIWYQQLLVATNSSSICDFPKKKFENPQM